MKQDFINYIKSEFNFSDQEISNFEKNLKQSLRKSIRVNTNKISISDFKLLASRNDWILEETYLGKNIFYIESNGDIALGNTQEHISGLFYIQEVSASSSPFYLSEDKVDNNQYLILDLSASPGGKTTQLGEYYPNSSIVANEIDKGRLKQLFSNLDRMSSLNVASSNYDGRFFKNIPELFDKVLIDAPCSGEGISFKTDESLKYWNIKNVKKVSKLQFGLLESSIFSLKVGGEIVYSTCTLNKIENEEVIEKALEKYREFIEIIPISKESNFKRNWPHRDLTGGFFVAKLRKIKSLNAQIEDKTNWKEKDVFVKQNFEKLTNNEQKIIERFFLSNFDYSLENKFLYKYKSDVYLSNQNINPIWSKLFLFKIGVHIGEIKNQDYIPSFFAGTFERFNKGLIGITKEQLDILYKGGETSLSEGINSSGNIYYQLICNNILAGIGKLKDNKIKSLIPSNMIRK